VKEPCDIDAHEIASRDPGEAEATNAKLKAIIGKPKFLSASRCFLSVGLTRGGGRNLDVSFDESSAPKFMSLEICHISESAKKQLAEPCRLR
jgi:hypothetical protein